MLIHVAMGCIFSGNADFVDFIRGIRLFNRVLDFLKIMMYFFLVSCELFKNQWKSKPQSLMKVIKMVLSPQPL